MGNSQATPKDRARIVCIGDVHGAWDKAADEKALRFLEPDLVLFVGDFGSSSIVRDISRLNMPKAAILGNHDCWGGAKLKQLFNVMSSSSGSSSDSFSEEQKQIRALGDSHVGFGRKDFGALRLSVVGGRPFSTGGALSEDDCACVMYGVRNLEESADKISSQGVSAPEEHSLVFLAHNGPKGLGGQPHDLCGRDFGGGEDGDYGDEDLAGAIARCRGSSRNVPLVVFGHMHRELRDGSSRKMVKCGEDGTVYVNAAVVPRERRDSGQRNFTVVELVRGVVTKVVETWVCVDPVVALGEETVLYESANLEDALASFADHKTRCSRDASALVVA